MYLWNNDNGDNLYLYSFLSTIYDDIVTRGKIEVNLICKPIDRLSFPVANGIVLLKDLVLIHIVTVPATNLVVDSVSFAI